MKPHLLSRLKGRTIVFGLAIAAVLAALLFYQFSFRPGRAMRRAAYLHFAASAAALRAGDDGQVESDLIAAIAAWPQYASAYARLGDFYSNHNQPGLAITAYHRLIEIDPDYPDVYGSMAQACYDDSSDADAQRYADEEIKRNPTAFRVLDTLAGLAIDRSDYRAAVADALKAYKLQPNDPGAMITYAESLLKEGSSEAPKILEEAKKRMPQSWEVAYDLGFCYLHSGNWEGAKAMTELRRAESLAPDQPSVHQELCRLLLKQQQFAAAEHEGELAVKEQADAPEALLLYSQALERQGKHAEAVPVEAQFRIRDAAERDRNKIHWRSGDFPTDPATAHQLATDYIKLGRDREAVVVLENALSVHQGNALLGHDMLGLLRAGVSP